MAEPIRTAVTPPPLKRNLRRGDSGGDVTLVQSILQAEGYFKGTPLGNFGGITETSLKHFQGTHIGEDGEFLKADGEVGPKTWWSLHNAHGSAQRSFIPADDRPDVVAESDQLDRLRFLEFLYALHRKGVQEIPDGSNYGDGVTAIVNACGFKSGIYWCLAAQSYAYREVFGQPPLGAMHVQCSTFWNEAHALGKAHPKKGYTPIPGDIAIYNYVAGLLSNGRLSGAGHAACVARVSEDGKQFNALEGNIGNRFKHSIRNVSEGTLVGYVNLYGDEASPPKFARGVTTAPVIAVTLAESR
jgi:peptidoglycan hydrolase-like protein with peptidoglycan-binding domain